jgi:hypothetical protein
MSKSKVIVLILNLLVIKPIFLYLCYKVLLSVNASELMMFLFWIYAPVTVLCAIIVTVTDDEKEQVRKIEKKVSKFQERLDEAMNKK